MDFIHIAKTIKECRKCQNMTVAQLATKSGFTKGFISQLENFRVTPSLNALNKIADALGMTIADFFQPGVKSPEFVFGNINKGEEIIRDDSDKFGINYFSLAFSKLDRAMEPFMVEYNKADDNRQMLLHDSDEFFVVLEGELDFVIFDEENKRRMKQGDTVYLARNIPHAVRLPDHIIQAKALIVYCQSK